MAHDTSKKRFGPDYEEKDSGYSTPCWVWLKSLNDGKPIKYVGSKGRMSAAKFYYQQEKKLKLHPGQVLYKLCEQPVCVNPDHMEPMGKTAAGRKREKDKDARKNRQQKTEQLLKQREEAHRLRQKLREEKAQRTIQKYNDNKVDKTKPLVTYFVQAGNGGPVKVGVSRNFKARFKTLQALNPYTLNVLKIADTNSKDLESHFMDRFKRSRIHGEWFWPSGEMLDYIRNCEP